jgi:hypothetical protein
VAGVVEEVLFPDLDEASVAAFAAIDKELRPQQAEEYVLPTIRNQIVLALHLGDQCLRGLIDTGSEINLMSEATATRLTLPLHPLLRPTLIQLALDNKAKDPLYLQYFTSITLRDPAFYIVFPDVALKVGPLNGNYDMILGTPFLSQFNLSVSISYQSLHCNKSNVLLFDYHLCPPVPSVSAVSAVTSTTSPFDLPNCMDLRATIFWEFRDLFLVDIPGCPWS